MGRRAVRICYDLSISPPTYDCVSFALWANAVRKKEDLTVVISPGPQDGFRADNTWPKETKLRRTFINNIAVPCFEMIPAEVEMLDTPLTEKMMDGVGARRYGMEYFIEGLRLGGRSLRPLGTAVPYNDRLVTITLREAEHWPKRNSSVEDWMGAASELEKSGFKVVFVRDWAKAFEPLGDFSTAPSASVDLNLRGSLYRSALCNMFVSNGPTFFSIAIDAPTLIFKPCIEDDDWFYSRAFWVHHGVKDQFPDNPPHQKIIWEQDRADIIVSEFLKWHDKS